MTPKRWFITGCTSGLGRALAEHLLERGDKVVVTGRRLDGIRDLVTRAPKLAVDVALDITKPAQVREALTKAYDAFGGIDVLVNNAGYGIQGAIEDATDSQIRAVFETNVFGVLDVIRAALPRMRAQHSGRIINITSVGGRFSAPMIGLYSATKYAVEGLSKGLAGDVAAHGIKVTVIEPGAFATKFGANLTRIEPSSAYAEPAAMIDGLLAQAQYNEPADAARVIAKVADLPEPPFQLVLGRDARGTIGGAPAGQQAELARWCELSFEASGA